LSSPASTLQPGYMLKSTTYPREMDRIFQKIHDQERAHNEQLIEKLYNRGREYYEARRKGLINKLGSTATSEAEKGIIREALKLMDEKDSKMQKNSVYGVSAMEESAAPLPPSNTRVM
jgi:hypothetical protein